MLPAVVLELDSPALEGGYDSTTPCGVEGVAGCRSRFSCSSASALQSRLAGREQNVLFNGQQRCSFSRSSRFPLLMIRKPTPQGPSGSSVPLFDCSGVRAATPRST